MRADKVRDAPFDPSEFNVEELDNKLEQLEDPSDVDLVRKNARYKLLQRP